jgi:hypothetical protein
MRCRCWSTILRNRCSICILNGSAEDKVTGPVKYPNKVLRPSQDTAPEPRRVRWQLQFPIYNTSSRPEAEEPSRLPPAFGEIKQIAPLAGRSGGRGLNSSTCYIPESYYKFGLITESRFKRIPVRAAPLEASTAPSEASTAGMVGNRTRHRHRRGLSLAMCESTGAALYLLLNRWLNRAQLAEMPAALRIRKNPEVERRKGTRKLIGRNRGR